MPNTAKKIDGRKTRSHASRIAGNAALRLRPWPSPKKIIAEAVAVQQPTQPTAQLPSAFEFLFRPYRYKGAYGGRGSAKSWSFARALTLKAASAPLLILCAREYQNSIADSVHRLICDQIEMLNYERYFKITDKSITSTEGSEFIFKGLHHNVDGIRSLEGVNVAWIEEAQRVSDPSWKTLIPTIREPGSEIWATWNTLQEDDATHTRLVENTPPDSYVVKVNYDQNPWFPDTLRAEMEYCKKVDYDAYLHIWEGEPRSVSDAQIMHGKYRVESFEAPSTVERFFYGADWGFAKDPTCLIRCFIQGRKLFIDYEVYGVGVEIDETPKLFDHVPGARKWSIKADNSRPETISAVKRAGFNISAAQKWDGCVEDGIAYIRSFEEIIIHERCKHTADEARLYSYKTDRITEEVLPIVVDKHNHCWDAVRYSLDGYITKRGEHHTPHFAMISDELDKTSSFRGRA